MSTAIKFNEVKKSYQDHLVLDGVNLDVNVGEFVGLIGMNGAGKTTLIKCLLDFTLIDSGEISIFNTPHRETRSREKLVYLPEKFNPPYYLTGHDFLDYMGDLHQVKFDQEQIRDVLQVLDLEESALKKSVRKYSKGMSQKLGLAACFLSGKDLLILDEPMSGLDPRARAWLKQYLLELKQAGRSLFFSTHLLADVEVLADKIAILHQGVVRFYGTLEQCFSEFACEDMEQAYLKCIEA